MLDQYQTETLIKYALKAKRWDDIASFMVRELGVQGLGRAPGVFMQSIEEHPELTDKLPVSELEHLANFMSLRSLQNSPLRKKLSPEFQTRFTQSSYSMLARVLIEAKLDPLTHSVIAYFVERGEKDVSKISAEIERQIQVEGRTFLEIFQPLKPNLDDTADIATRMLAYYNDQHEPGDRMETAKVEAADPSAQPPKKWWNKMEKEIKEGNPSYNQDQIDKTIGDIWYHKLDDTKRREIRGREGKHYKAASMLERVLAEGQEAHNSENLDALEQAFNRFMDEEMKEAGEHDVENLQGLRRFFDKFIEEEKGEQVGATLLSKILSSQKK